jgi:hypothetical protein
MNSLFSCVLALCISAIVSPPTVACHPVAGLLTSVQPGGGAFEYDFGAEGGVVAKNLRIVDIRADRQPAGDSANVKGRLPAVAFSQFIWTKAIFIRVSFRVGTHCAQCLTLL